MKETSFFINFFSCLIAALVLPGCNSENLSAKLEQKSMASEKKTPQITLKALAPSYESGKYSFDGIALLDNGDIWAVGYDGVNPRRVRYSTDGGKTWNITTFSSEFNMLNAILFADDLHGWASGIGDIFRTSNGGKSWEKTDLKRYLDFTMLSFYNREIGYFTGKLNIQEEEASEIWKTVDGGETWKKSYVSKKWQNPFAILAVSETVALAVLDENNLIRTTDGGGTWHVIESFDYSTDQLYKDKNGRIWAVGRNGNFFYSIDEGTTWNRPENFPDVLKYSSWNSIGFADRQTGVAVGDKGSIALTQDGGTSWRLIESKTNENFSRIYLNQNMGLIVGSDNLYKFEL